MAEYIPDDLPLSVAESTRISNNTVELTQTWLPSFNISDSYQDPKQIHDKYIEDLSYQIYHSILQMT